MPSLTKWPHFNNLIHFQRHAFNHVAGASVTTTHGGGSKIGQKVSLIIWNAPYFVHKTLQPTETSKQVKMQIKKFNISYKVFLFQVKITHQGSIWIVWVHDNLGRSVYDPSRPHWWDTSTRIKLLFSLTWLEYEQRPCM